MQPALSPLHLQEAQELVLSEESQLHTGSVGTARGSHGDATPGLGWRKGGGGSQLLNNTHGVRIVVATR